jgi:hypothetical protein
MLHAAPPPRADASTKSVRRLTYPGIATLGYYSRSTFEPPRPVDSSLRHVAYEESPMLGADAAKLVAEGAAKRKKSMEDSCRGFCC